MIFYTNTIELTLKTDNVSDSLKQSIFQGDSSVQVEDGRASVLCPSRLDWIRCLLNTAVDESAR